MSEKRTWLEGPLVPGENEDPTKLSSYPGENLGLPREGKGSLAGLFPRMAALLIDWSICYAMAAIITPNTNWFGDNATASMIFFIIWRVVTVWLFAQSPGHAIMCGPHRRPLPASGAVALGGPRDLYDLPSAAGHPGHRRPWHARPRHGYRGDPHPLAAGH